MRTLVFGGAGYIGSVVSAKLACALDAGALGARVTGGGFGGSAIALCASERQAALTDRVVEGFRAAGFGAPRIFPVRPSEGASRVV